jgi:hypothetical protein
MTFDFIFNAAEVGLMIGAIGLVTASHYHLSDRIDELYNTVMEFVKGEKK